MSEWISVEDKVPTDNDSYLVYGRRKWEDEPTEWKIEVSSYEFLWETVEDTETRTVNEQTAERVWFTGATVTHWQPLPSPP